MMIDSFGQGMLKMKLFLAEREHSYRQEN
jgi:hypothetical protein